MRSVEFSADERPGLSWRFNVLSSAWERLRGLLGTGTDATPVLLLRCSSVHTFAMRYALDLAFVGKNGQVLLSCRSVPPGRLVSRNDAFCVLERPTSALPWPEEGERIRVIALNVNDDAVVPSRERTGYEH